MKKPVTLKIEEIRLDCPTQPRVELDDDTISRYKETVKVCLESKTPLPWPPVEVYRDGSYLWISDGRQRLAALKAEGVEYVDAFVFEGTVRDAFLNALATGRTHGKPLTTEDKVYSIKLMLSDEEWMTKSLNWIAEQVGCSHSFVANVARSMGKDGVARKGKDGKVRKPRKAPKKKEREAGDDSEEVRADEKKARPGKELVNFAKIHTHIGRLARSVTAIGNTYRHERQTEEWKGAKVALSEFAGKMKKLQKRLERV